MRLLYSRHLEHFLAIFDTRSLRKAAQASGVTQPALTKSLRVLESALSVTLFERHAAGVQPTRAGVILRRHAQHIVNSSRHAALELAQLKSGQSGALRVGSGIVWSVGRMPRMLAALHAKYPQLEVTLETGISEQLVPRLVDGHLDVVFASIPREPLPPGFKTVRLPDADMRVFGRRQHPLARRRSVALRSLAGYDFVGFLDDLDSQRHMDAAFGEGGTRTPRITLRASSLDAILATVAGSDSLVVLADLLKARAVAAGLAPIPMAAPVWRIPMGIMYHEHNEELAALRGLVEASGE